MTKKYILVNGSPQVCDDIVEWGRWFEDSGSKRVLSQWHQGDVMISTVFLALDYSWTGGPPVLWETMVFGGERDGYQERYTSAEEAIAGHARVVETVQTKNP